jgi:hypothetical protein
MSGEQPVEEGSAGTTDVEIAGGRWSEADARSSHLISKRER